MKENKIAIRKGINRHAHRNTATPADPMFFIFFPPPSAFVTCINKLCFTSY